MIKFAIWIATGDLEISVEWHRLFSRECFHTVQLQSLSALDQPPGTWGLVFAEAGVEGLAAPEDLGVFLGGRKNISVMVFSRPGRAANPLIAEFLESGADDFITTDIDGKVLLAKTKAHIRRLLPSLNMAKTVIVSENGDFELDRTKRIVRTGIKSRKERVLETLTPKEFEILFLLLANEGRVVSRTAIMEEVWLEKAGRVNCETVDKHVETLRVKLGACGKNIRTVYGTGYTYKS